MSIPICPLNLWPIGCPQEPKNRLQFVTNNNGLDKLNIFYFFIFVLVRDTDVEEICLILYTFGWLNMRFGDSFHGTIKPHVSM
jgi:hypothetical protein